MTFDTMYLVVLLGMLSGLFGWLVIGVRDNIMYPEQNRALTDKVLSMALIADQYPQFWDQIGHRRVENPATQALLFRFIVAAEVVVCAVLALGLAAVVAALSGRVPVEVARSAALAGALGYTMIWVGFLVAGNHFAYWLCHKEQQFTHFHMMLWGLGTMVLVVGFQG